VAPPDQEGTGGAGHHDRGNQAEIQCAYPPLGNPGFETGSAAPWTSTAGVINSNGAGETAHSGSWYASLDGYGTTHTDTLSQTVTIPAGCTARVTATGALSSAAARFARLLTSLRALVDEGQAVGHTR
jgi:phosphatidylinositol-3-phosphatase